MATITKPSTSKTRIRRPRSSRPSTRLSAHIPTRSRRLTASSPSYWAPKPQPSTNPQRQQEQQTTIDLARLLHATLNPVFFAREFLGFHPEPAQEKLLRASNPFKRIGLNCNRQWGKSTIAAILIAHRLYTHPGVTVLIVAPAGRQSGETLRKVEGFLVALHLQLRPDGVNPDSLQLPNGSRVVALPAVDRTARGFSAVSMILFDEAARVADRVYLAFRPMLAVGGGDLIIISTPAGRRGFFYREMTATGKASEKWFRHTGPASECNNRIDKDVLEEEMSKGDTYYRQEWLCEFIETGRYTFDEQLLHKIVKEQVEAYNWI